MPHLHRTNQENGLDMELRDLSRESTYQLHAEVGQGFYIPVEAAAGGGPDAVHRVGLELSKLPGRLQAEPGSDQLPLLL